jgi:hypothetical protein
MTLGTASVRRALLVPLVLLATGPLHAADAPPPDLLCHVTRGGASGHDASVETTDRFGTRTARLGALVRVCRPARAAFGAEPAGAAALALYRGRVGRKTRRVGESLELTTRLGPARFVVKALEHVGSAAGIDDDPIPVTPGVTACYSTRPRGAGRAERVVVVADARGEHALRLGRMRHLCIDPGGQERLCYAARAVPRGSERDERERLHVATDFGAASLSLGRAVELCLPPGSDEPPPPPPPSGPGFFLRISPSSRTVAAGSHPAFAARAYFDVGGSEDWSDRVLWRSSDERVAVVHGSAGGAIVDAAGEGTAVLSVVHVPSGVTSTESGGDATLTVVWPLEKLTISPPAVRKKVGDFEEYTVTGHFTGGSTLNLTQRVTYASDNTAVARLDGNPARRSLVRTITSGIARISATDPATGINTTDAGNDAILRVGGGLSYVQVEPGRFGVLVLRVGEVDHLTAIGHYSDGSTRNLTQECVWVSGDPAIVRVPSEDGDRSRIEALAGGTAGVDCRDAEGRYLGGISLEVVTDELLALELRNGQSPPLREGHPRSVTALGVFAPFTLESYRGRRNLTQEVVYHSRDPEIAVATNEDGNRSRIVGVGPGCARIYAEDPASGIGSPDHVLCNLGGLVGVSLQDRFASYPVPVGTWLRPTIWGVYEAGWLNLSRREPTACVFESSDPSVLEVALAGQVVVARSPGRARVWARHLSTGFTSDPLEFVVRGLIDRLRITPASITRAIGETEEYTVIGLSAPAFEDLVTQDVEYHSSDPSVAVPSNEAPRRSLVRTVGAGRATISAVYPATGARTETDAVIEVLPGAIERITIEPAEARINPENTTAFTAIGHYGDGRTINVTSQVRWTAVDASVARSSDRSRFEALAPGTTRIVAEHPTGVSSSDSHDDATLRVEPLVDLALTPSTRTFRVGDTVRFTLTGRFADGTSINVTQHAYYYVGTDTYPGPARADNRDGDRSAVVGVLPGTATLHAQAFSQDRTAALIVDP